MKALLVILSLFTILLTGSFTQSSFGQADIFSGGVDHPGKWWVGEGLKKGDYFEYNVCHGDYRECADFEFGEFKITSENGTTYIERKENIQIEKNGDKISISDIEWINDCTYILKNHRWENGDIIEEEKNNIYTVEIIEFSDKILRVRTKSNYSDLSVERVMEIVE